MVSSAYSQQSDDDGIELRVKFRLPLLGHQRFEATTVVTAVQEEPEAVAIGTEFLEIDSQTRGAVEQYARDMAFLKAELGDVRAAAAAADAAGLAGASPTSSSSSPPRRRIAARRMPFPAA